MKIFADLPTQWQDRVARATVCADLAVLLVSGALMVSGRIDGLGSITVGGVVALLLTLIHLVATLALYFALKLRDRIPHLHLILSGLFALASFLMFVFLPTVDGMFLMTWFITLLLSGLYGLIPLAAMLLINNIYFALTLTGVLAQPYENELVVVLGAVGTAGMGAILWDVFRIGQATLAHTGAKLSSSELRSKISSDTIIGSIGDGIILVDTNLNIQLINEAGAGMLGWTIADAVAISQPQVLKLLTPEDQPIPSETNPFMRSLSSGDTIRDNQARAEIQSGKKIELSLIVSPVRSEDGSIVAAIGIFRDISEERSQERQRAEFISTASHEMRTPVAAIEGYLALALNEKVSKIDSAARGYLEKAHASTEHLGKLFQDLLTAAKTEDGRISNHPEVIEAGTFLDELAEGMRFTAEKKGLVLEYLTSNKTINATPGGSGEVVRPLYYMHADPERMREVITNLFDNAIKYTQDGKITIGLSTSADQKEIVISVGDTGPGIPPEDIPHLFQKFYRVDNTATRQIGGTGLGLFICRKIVELYAGRIWVESELDKGSTFYVSLPRLSAVEAQDRIKREALQKTVLKDQPTSMAP